MYVLILKQENYYITQLLTSKYNTIFVFLPDLIIQDAQNPFKIQATRPLPKNFSHLIILHDQSMY